MLRKMGIIAGLALTTFAFADRIYVDDPTTTPDVDAKTLRQLLRSAVTEQGHEIADQASKCDFVLKTNLLKLGSSYIYTAEKWVDGKSKYSTKLKATKIEELDEISQRLVRAVASGVVAKKDAHVDDVTEDEATQQLRKKTAQHKGTTLAIGPASLMNLGTSRVGYYFGIGRDWEMGNFSMGMRADLTFAASPSQNTAVMFDFNLNFAYYFLPTDISPFLQAEFGYGLARDAISEGTFGGLDLGGMAGVAFLRTYRIHPIAGLRFNALVGSGFYQTPYAVTFVLGIAF